MARWITIKKGAVPFDYRWPDATAYTAFTTAGEEFVKDEVADWAVEQGYATEGKARASAKRSVKGKSTAPPKRATVRADATPPIIRPDAGLVRAGNAPDGAPENGRAVDPASGK